MRPNRTRWLIGIAMIGVLIGMFHDPCRLAAQDQESAEARIRAAYLYNFCLFINWPPSAFKGARDPLVIGVAGRNPFIDLLTELVQGKTANGRPVIVHRIASPEEARDIQVLFLGFSDGAKIDEYLAALGKGPVLTVSDFPAFNEHGGMIRLFTEQNRIRYEINLEAAKGAQLQIQSRVLALAKITPKG